MSSTSYLGNPKLKAANVQLDFTEEQISEILKCRDDPIHFIEQYVQIVHVDRGLVPFEMYPFQKKMVESFVDTRFVISIEPALRLVTSVTSLLNSERKVSNVSVVATEVADIGISSSY